jgi:Icc-related predicted phosphoesterase
MYGSYDVVVHSGDFFPDPPGDPQFKSQIGLWQLDWLQANLSTMKQWLNGSPFLFTLGNHDWAYPPVMEKLLNDNGIQAVCLHDRVVDFNSVHFYGFPYVPAINGQYNYEREIPEMRMEVKMMVDKINNADYVDVMVCHAPPHQNLDLASDNKILGSTVIANALDYEILPEKMPTHYFCGHIHNANGITMRNKILISNAARSKHIIEIK